MSPRINRIKDANDQRIYLFYKNIFTLYQVQFFLLVTAQIYVQKDMCLYVYASTGQYIAEAL